MYSHNVPENSPDQPSRPFVERVHTHLDSLRISEIAAVTGGVTLMAVWGDILLKSADIKIVPDIVDTGAFVLGAAGVIVGGISLADRFMPPKLPSNEPPTSETE